MAENQITTDTSYESILQQASQERSIIFSISKAYPAYIILVLTIALSFGAWYLVEQKVQSDRQAAFDKAVNSVMGRMEVKYQSDYQVLQSMRSLYDNYVQVVRDVFELYGSIPVRTYESLISIMWAPRIEGPYIEDFIHYARSQGYYDYVLHPEGIRDVYYPVEYVVPLEKNFQRSGYDLITDEQLKLAIEKARDENIVVATPVDVVRKPDTVGFFLVSPIYDREAKIGTKELRNQNFKGSLVLEINSMVFFQTALGNGVPSDTSIVFEVIDQDVNGSEKKIFESENAYLLKSNYEPYILSNEKIKIADRYITAKFYTIPNFGGTFQKILPISTFIAAIIISIGFAAFILSVISSRQRAINLAERMTRSQRRILETSNDIIAVMDMNGNWKSMNPASINIFGFEPTKMIGQKFESLLIDEDEKKHLSSILSTQNDEKTERFDTQVISSESDETKWISWSFTISRTDQLVYCIGRDITLEKIAEEEAILRSKQVRLAEQLAREVSEFKTYFMLKLSHQLRNSLTGMIGYLQLLSQKIYENDEEHDTFVNLAEQSSEELYTFVSDIDDVAGGSDENASKVELSLISIDKLIGDVNKNLNTDEEDTTKYELKLLDESQKANVVADYTILQKTFKEIAVGLSEGLDISNIQINAEENTYEGATEIQILGPSNKMVMDIIKLFNNNLSSHIESLKKDKKDIMLRFALASSNIRMMNGTMKIDTFGEKDGNIVLITLPLNKQ